MTPGKATRLLGSAPRRTVSTAAASAAVALVPLWRHLVLVDSGLNGIIAVFAEVGLYPGDVCLLALSAVALATRARLPSRSRWLGAGLTLLPVTALLSVVPAPNQPLAAAVAGHLALLALAWLGLCWGRASRTALVGALVASAAVQSLLAVAQFVLQQPLVPSQLHLPWLPSDIAEGGTPVILNAQGVRLLRGFGTFPHPNVLGGYLAIAIVCVPLLRDRWPRHAWFWWLPGVLIGAGLLACFSRAAWLASLVGLSAWWLSATPRRGRWWLAPVAVGALIIGVAASPLAPTIEQRLSPIGPDANALERGSVENRLALDRAALAEIADHWLLGVGAGNYGQVAVAEGRQEGWGEPVPNLALLITAELGLPGTAALLLVLVATVRAVRAPHGLDVAPTAALLALVVLAMLDHYLWTMPPGRVIAWTPIALVAARTTAKRCCPPPA